MPGLLFGNGMAWVDQRLLIADSLRGLILTIEPDHGTSSVWLAHELLSKTDPNGGPERRSTHSSSRTGRV